MGIDWAKVAERRMDEARQEARRAKQLLTEGNHSAKERYQEALAELGRAERFLHRAVKPGEWPVGEGQGIFG